MTYRSDVEALAARTDALAAEVAQKTRELDASRSILDEARAKAKLPVLPNIKVATPCTAEWAAMSGDERTRACGACNKNVYNISALTRDEAEALILEHEGRLCVRYFQRKDGTILLKDCSIGITQKRKRRVIAAGVAALLGGTVLAWITLPKSSKGVAASVNITPSPDPTVAPFRESSFAEPPPAAPLEAPPVPEIEVPHATMGAMALPMNPEPDDPFQTRDEPSHH